MFMYASEELAAEEEAEERKRIERGANAGNV